MIFRIYSGTRGPFRPTLLLKQAIPMMKPKTLPRSVRDYVT